MNLRVVKLNVLFILLLSSYTRTDKYLREIALEPLLKKTVQHVIHNLLIMDKSVQHVRRRLLTVGVPMDGRNDATELIYDGLLDLYILEQRIKYSLHMLQSTGWELLLRPKDADKKFKKKKKLLVRSTKKPPSTTTPKPQAKHWTDSLVLLLEHMYDGRDTPKTRYVLNNLVAKVNQSSLPVEIKKYFYNDPRVFEKGDRIYHKYLKPLKFHTPEFLQKADKLCEDDEEIADELYSIADSYIFDKTEANFENDLVNMISRYADLFKKLESTKWPTLRDDAKLLISFQNDPHSETLRRSSGGAISPNLFEDSTKGYLSEALQRLTAYVQQKDDADIGAILKQLKAVFVDHLKKYDLFDTNLGIYLMDHVSLLTSAKAAKEIASLYDSNGKGTAYAIIQKGDDMLNNNKKMGEALLKAIEEFKNFKNGGRDSAGRARLICNKIVSTILRELKTSKGALRSKKRPTLEQKMAIDFLKMALNQLKNEVVYNTYVLNLNGKSK